MSFAGAFFFESRLPDIGAIAMKSRNGKVGKDSYSYSPLFIDRRP